MWKVFALGLWLAQSDGGRLRFDSRADALERVENLTKAASPKAQAQLIGLLGHPLQDVRAAALRGLGHLGAAETVDHALAWLGSHELAPRLDALAVLGLPTCPFPPAAAERVLGELGDPRPELRLAALALLAARGVSVPSPMLALLVEDETPAVRTAALLSFGDRHNPAARYAIAGRLNDVDVAVRLAAITAAGRSRDPALRPLLEHLLQASDPTWAVAAIDALGALGDRTSVAVLTPLVQQPGASAKITRAAIGALGMLGGEEAARALVLRLHFMGPYDPAIDVTLTALGKLGHEAETATLPFVTVDTQAPLLERFVSLLADVGGPRSVVALSDLLSETTPVVPATLVALKRLGARCVPLHSARAALLAATKDPSQTVRRAAREFDTESYKRLCP